MTTTKCQHDNDAARCDLCKRDQVINRQAGTIADLEAKIAAHGETVHLHQTNVKALAAVNATTVAEVIERLNGLALERNSLAEQTEAAKARVAELSNSLNQVASQHADVCVKAQRATRKLTAMLECHGQAVVALTDAAAELRRQRQSLASSYRMPNGDITDAAAIEELRQLDELIAKCDRAATMVTPK